MKVAVHISQESLKRSSSKVAVHTSQESLRRKHLNFQTAVHTSQDSFIRKQFESCSVSILRVIKREAV